MAEKVPGSCVSLTRMVLYRVSATTLLWDPCWWSCAPQMCQLGSPLSQPPLCHDFVSQDKMALSLWGAIVTLLKSTALHTLLRDLHPKQICSSSSFCQTHPHHPRSPVCLGLLVPPYAYSCKTFMHGSSTRDFTRSYYVSNLFKLDYGAFLMLCLSILCIIECCWNWS